MMQIGFARIPKMVDSDVTIEQFALMVDKRQN